MVNKIDLYCNSNKFFISIYSCDCFAFKNKISFFKRLISACFSFNSDNSLSRLMFMLINSRFVSNSIFLLKILSTLLKRTEISSSVMLAGITCILQLFKLAFDEIFLSLIRFFIIKRFCPCLEFLYHKNCRIRNILSIFESFYFTLHKY